MYNVSSSSCTHLTIKRGKDTIPNNQPYLGHILYV